MKLLVDTSVWSLALRRDAPPDLRETKLLARALEGDSEIYVTGLILQELLQGFVGPTAKDAIVERFAALPLVVPDISDHIKAAELRNLCRRNGIQIGTIDALIAQLAIRFELELLTADDDFKNMAKYVRLNLAL